MLHKQLFANLLMAAYSVEMRIYTKEMHTCSVEMATRSVEISTRSVEMAAYTKEMHAYIVEMSTRSAEMAIYSVEMVARSVEMASRTKEISTCSAEMSTCSVEMSTRSVEMDGVKQKMNAGSQKISAANGKKPACRKEMSYLFFLDATLSKEQESSCGERKTVVHPWLVLTHFIHISLPLKLIAMISRDSSKLKMYRVVQQLCDANSSITATNAAFMMAYALFCTNISLMMDTVGLASEVTTGITTDKNVDKDTLCQETSDLAGLIFAYASGVDNNTLSEAVDFSYSDLHILRGDLLITTANNIHKLAVDNKVALQPFGINDESLAEHQTNIDDYRKSLPAHRTAVSIKGTHTEGILDIVADTDRILKKQMDKMVVVFKKKYPGFVASFINARMILEPHTATKAVTPPAVEGKV